MHMFICKYVAIQILLKEANYVPIKLFIKSLPLAPHIPTSYNVHTDIRDAAIVMTYDMS